MAYCTKTDVENYLQVGINASLDTQVSAWILAVTAWIERYTKRRFEASSQVKKYDGKGRNYILVDDLLSLSDVYFTSNDSTADDNTRHVDTGDILLYQDDDPNLTPYNKLELSPYSSYKSFPPGRQNIVIDGSFGFSSVVPDDIKLVATKLTASIIKVGKDDGVSSFSEGDLSLSYTQFDRLINMDVGAKDVLEFYKKKERLMGFEAIRV